MRIARNFLFLTAFLFLLSCGGRRSGSVILTQSFDDSGWEKFKPVSSCVEVSKPTTYDLSLKVCFAPSYAYNDFDVVFTVFDASNEPYRAKSYSFRVKDNDGNWKSQGQGAVYEFMFPINNCLTLSESGKYRFEIESRMPITPLLGVRKMELLNNE